MKTAIAWDTIGTNDTITFFHFAKLLHEHGLQYTYQNSILFNHPPLTAYYLEFIYWLSNHSWCQESGLGFPFLLRLPAILADLITVVMIVWAVKARLLHLPTWALCLLAVSPVSIMVSGFHGNTDPVLVMFLVAAALMCLIERPALCGLFFALSCQVKIVPLIFLPVFFLYWLTRRQAWRFLAPVTILTLVGWSEPLFNFPALFFRNVIFYGSYWGGWGITFLLHATNLPQFSHISFFGFSESQKFVTLALKLIIIAATLILGLRRRNLPAHGLLGSLAYVWLIFFVFSPGICVQYFVWLAPFMLFFSPILFGCIVATSSLFVFMFYTTTAHGLPWYLAISTNELNEIVAPWSLVPWVTMIIALFLLWNNASRAERSLRLWSLKVLPSSD